MYFIFPLEKPQFELTTKPKNNNLFDFILDPVGKCSVNMITWINNNSTNEIQDKVKKTNCFYHLENNSIMNSVIQNERKTNTSILTLKRVTYDNKQEEYFVNFVTFVLSRIMKFFILLLFLENVSKWNGIPFSYI